MLRFIKNNLLWSQTFDDAFRSGDTFFNEFNDRRMQEKKYHWRERLGRQSGFSPEEAAFRAYEEFADDYYNTHKDRPGAEKQFRKIAYALSHAAPFMDRDGNYKGKEFFLSEKWKVLLADYYKQRSIENPTQKELNEQISSFQYDASVIHLAWDELIVGKPPWEAKSVFRGAHAFCTPHHIVSKMIVPLERVMFWLIVLRENNMVIEETRFDKHVYLSKYAEADPDTLQEPYRTVVTKLR